MATTSRTLVLQSPHLTGQDIGDLQRDLNTRYEAWDIDKRIGVDNDYGKDTRDAAREVCGGLGIVLNGGVTAELRLKIHDPDRRTDDEVHRSKGAEATALRAHLRKQFSVATSGLALFDGKQVAAWIVPSLKWARAHGWTGRVNSGFRSCADQKIAAAQFAASQHKTIAEIYPNGVCASNHVGMDHPRGAVDVTNPAQLDQVLRNNPNHPKLVWGGPVIGDEVHFSANGH